MKNPIETFVENNQDSRALSNYTHLAKTAGISTQVVTKTLKGVYPRIPPSLLFVMSDMEATYSRSESWWQGQYSLWIEQEVERLKKDLESGAYEGIALYENPNQYPTFVDWRKSFDDSLMGFCTRWRLPHATMIGWEKGNGLELPLVLRDRLSVLLPVTGKTEKEIEEYIHSLTYLPRRR